MNAGMVRLRPRRALAVPMLIVAAMIGGLAAGAAIQRVSSQAPTPLITACVNAFTGAVRMGPTGGAIACTGNERQVQWNQQGIQGSPGPQGEMGEQGPQGEQGPPGDTSNLVPLNAMTAVCVDGDNVLGGGYEFVYDQDGFVPPHGVSDRPFNATASQEGWLITLFHDGSPLIAEVYAICSNPGTPGTTYVITQNYQVGDAGEGGEGGGGDDGR